MTDTNNSSKQDMSLVPITSFVFSEARVVKEPSQTIQSSHLITVQQKKAFDALLYLARQRMDEDDPAGDNQPVFAARLSDIKRLAGIEATNNQQIKEALKELVSIVIEYNLLGKDKEVVWGAFPLLDLAEIKNGIFYYHFAYRLYENIRNPKMFANIDLATMRSLMSKPAIVLYQMAEDYIESEIPEIAFPTLKKILGVAEKRVFKEFRRSILDQAVAEVNEKTTITMYYDVITGQRGKAQSIKFYTSRKESIVELADNNGQEAVESLPSTERIPPAEAPEEIGSVDEIFPLGKHLFTEEEDGPEKKLTKKAIQEQERKARQEEQNRVFRGVIHFTINKFQELFSASPQFSPSDFKRIKDVVKKIGVEDTEGLLLYGMEIGYLNNGCKITPTSILSNDNINSYLVKKQNGNLHLPSSIPFETVIDYLNQHAETNHKAEPIAIKLIWSRWEEGYRLPDFKRVIDTMCAEWKNDERFSNALCAQTLFKRENFPKYLAKAAA